jgi:hypothetical protein
MDRDKMSIIYRESSIDASYQVSVHLLKRFQRRRILEINQSEEIIVCGGHATRNSKTPTQKQNYQPATLRCQL